MGRLEATNLHLGIKIGSSLGGLGGPLGPTATAAALATSVVVKTNAEPGETRLSWQRRVQTLQALHLEQAQHGKQVMQKERHEWGRR
jgi:hypothetical protein